MELWSQWVYSILASSAGATALIALAAYLGRTHLSHWLSKDLEAQKAAYQRELEAYKVSLIAEAERAKASQDVQKAMAIRIADKKFSAIEDLHKRLASKSTSALSSILVNLESEHKRRLAVMAREVMKLSEASDAAALAEPFLSPEEIRVMHTLIGNLSSAFEKFGQQTCAISKEDFAALKIQIGELQRDCDAILKSHISKMLSMK